MGRYSGNGMSPVQTSYQQGGPRLKLPPRPNRRYFKTFKEQRAEIERLEWLDGDSVRANMERAKPTWEFAMNDWQNKCDAIRANYRKRKAAYDAERKAETERRTLKWQETIAYCEAHGLPSPNSQFYR